MWRSGIQVDLTRKKNKRMNIRKANTFLLMGTFGLLMLHLCKYLVEHQTLHFHEDVTADTSTEEVTGPTAAAFIWSTCRPNVSAANVIGFSSLPDHIQDFLYYRHCRRFPLLLDVPDKCGGADESAEVFLLLVIKSSPGNYDRREVLRKTWAKERLHNGVWIRRLFITGTTASGSEKERLNHVLTLENREYNDILQWDFSDSFFNLTLKQILFLDWMETNCPHTRFLLNGDDDVFANTDNMVEYLQSLTHNNGSKHLFIGHLIKSAIPVRSPQNKYYIPRQVYKSNRFPPYCGGGGFLLSGHTAMVIYNMSKSVTVVPIDDAYMGMCLAKAGLAPAHHMGVNTLWFNIPSKKPDMDNPCYYREILLIHKFDTARIYLMWDRIHDPKLKCGAVKPTYDSNKTKTPSVSSKIEVVLL